MLSNLAKRFGKGFTLIELMIVVAIIGILAAIAVPNFVKFQCRSKQSEAKTNLKALYVAQEGYRGEYDNYATIPVIGNSGIATTNPAGWNPKGQNIRYDYESPGANAEDFTATATGAADLTGDLWTINNGNELGNTNNFCNQ